MNGIALGIRSGGQWTPVPRMLARLRELNAAIDRWSTVISEAKRRGGPVGAELAAAMLELQAQVLLQASLVCEDVEAVGLGEGDAPPAQWEGTREETMLQRHTLETLVLSATAAHRMCVAGDAAGAARLLGGALAEVPDRSGLSVTAVQS